MRSTATLGATGRYLHRRSRHTFRGAASQTPPWWPKARSEAFQSTRMLSTAMLLSLVVWFVVLTSVFVRFVR